MQDRCANEIGLTVALGGAVFVGIVALVQAARVLKPAVVRLAEVDLRSVTHAFGEGLDALARLQGPDLN